MNDTLNIFNTDISINEDFIEGVKIILNESKKYQKFWIAANYSGYYDSTLYIYNEMPVYNETEGEFNYMRSGWSFLGEIENFEASSEIKEFTREELINLIK